MTRERRRPARQRTRPLPPEGRRLEATTWRVDELIPDPENVKAHPPGQVEQIASSITQLGFRDHIGIKPDGTIVEGEGRMLAAQYLGMEEVPVIVLHGFTEREYKLYAVAHNKFTLQTPHDAERVRAALTAIFIGTDEELDYQSLGFSNLDIDWSEVNRGADAPVETSRPRVVAGGTAGARSRGNSVRQHELVFGSPDEHRDFRTFIDRDILTDANKTMTATARLLAHWRDRRGTHERAAGIAE